MAPEEIPREPQADGSTAYAQGVEHDAVGHVAPSLLWPTVRRLRDGIPYGDGRQQADDGGHPAVFSRIDSRAIPLSHIDILALSERTCSPHLSGCRSKQIP
jgi:hypothetical protein